MEPRNRIPLSHFPPDLLGVLLLPATVIFYAVASYLPRFWRGGVFIALGVLFVVAAYRLARSTRRVERWILAAFYVVIAILTFYLAYVEAVLFA
jgi:chromate transport protein ChrA